MIIFKTYTPRNVQNSQTTSKNVFEGVLSTQLEFSLKKTFMISRKASKNFFKGVLMIMLKFNTPRNV